MNYGDRYFITKMVYFKKCYTINIDLVKKIVKELQDDEPDSWCRAAPNNREAYIYKMEK